MEGRVNGERLAEKPRSEPEPSPSPSFIFCSGAGGPFGATSRLRQFSIFHPRDLPVFPLTIDILLSP